MTFFCPEGVQHGAAQQSAGSGRFAHAHQRHFAHGAGAGMECQSRPARLCASSKLGSVMSCVKATHWRLRFDAGATGLARPRASTIANGRLILTTCVAIWILRRTCWRLAMEVGGPSWLAAGRRARRNGLNHSSIAPWELRGSSRAPPRTSFKFRQPILSRGIAAYLPLLKSMEATLAGASFAPWPRFPAVERDFSLVAARGDCVWRGADAIRALGIAEITRIDPVICFVVPSIGEGRYSLLLRVTFRARKRR